MKKHFTSSVEVFAWLSQFINLERGQTPRSFNPERMKILAELAGHPERCAPAIHIAGSKGKGSVTGMIASVLEAEGRRPARYMSPHISDFRERVCLGNAFFDEAVYAAAGDELRDMVEQKLPASKQSLFDPACEDGEAPTFFELLTAYFFLCARIGRCDVMVVETGMGGRLDCTNIVDPLVSVITFIELEHTAFLGSTVAAVAGEKAGIIKPGKSVILARQGGEALTVFRKRASETNSPLLYFPEIAAIENLRIHTGGTDFSVAFNGGGNYAPSAVKLSIPIPGAVQAENAGLAVAVLKAAFPGIGDDVIRRGMARLAIPARFEKIIGADNGGGTRGGPLVIIDGAHTPESVDLCAETFCSLYGEGGVLLFGCAADKNAAAMAEILLPRFSKIIITTPGTFKISDPEKAWRAFSAGLSGQGASKTVFVQDTDEAIRQALETGREQGLPVLGTGSFYLASEIRKFVMV